jgi:hypothetical protein
LLSTARKQPTSVIAEQQSTNRKKRAVITAWQDGFTNINGKPMYHRLHADPRQIGHNGKYHGYRELVEHIAFAQRHCNGEFNVIVARAADPGAYPRQIAWCEPRPGIKLKIISFDESNGELWAEVV